LIGTAAQKIATQVGNIGVPLLQCGTLAEAVRQAHRLAKSGDTVLLAPACASFDQFESFEYRGRVFKDLVKALKEGSR
jgi:UDP-N-acetylmuramoylalanine--D-glutamate ligase